MNDIPREFASVVMDASQNEVRKYWSGSGWHHDPTMASRCRLHPEDMTSTYIDLYEAGCQVILALIEYSRTDGIVTVHNIKILEKVTYVQHN